MGVLDAVEGHLFRRLCLPLRVEASQRMTTSDLETFAEERMTSRSTMEL